MTSKVSEQSVSYGPSDDLGDDLGDRSYHEPEKQDEFEHKDIDALLKIDPSLWRGHAGNTVRGETIDSGFPDLNALLPTAGWPLQCVIELVVDQWGSGELQVLVPLMRQLGQKKWSLESQGQKDLDQKNQGQKIAFIAPPYLPYAPAFHNAGIDLNNLVIVDSDIPAKDKWWCAEKMLRHSDCGLVLVWPDRRYIRTWASQIRRLQVATTMANNLCMVFNCGKPVDTPVSLRLKLGYCHSGISVQIMKSRLSWQKGSTIIPNSALPA